MKPLGLTLALLAVVAAAPAFGDRYRYSRHGNEGCDRHCQDRYDRQDRQDRHGRQDRYDRHDDRRSSPRTYPHAPLAKPNPPFHPKAYGWKPPY